MNERKAKKTRKPDHRKRRNRPLRIPLNFEKAVEGLVNVKAKRPEKEVDLDSDRGSDSP